MDEPLKTLLNSITFAVLSLGVMITAVFIQIKAERPTENVTVTKNAVTEDTEVYRKAA